MQSGQEHPADQNFEYRAATGLLMGHDPPEHRNLFYAVATEWVEIANDANESDYESVLRDVKLVTWAENSAANLLTMFF